MPNEHATSDFWIKRSKKHGHTGWANKKTYIFDQQCRFQMLRDYIDQSGLKPGRALDFGCGSGDFSWLLIERGWEVVAFDPFVLPQFTHPKLILTQQANDIHEFGPYDLALSITALDHCLDDGEFQNRLNDISRSMSHGGKFFFLEYAGDFQGAKSAYQAFRSIAAWLDALKKAGLQAREIIPYFHPKDAPVAAWEKYKKMFRVRVMFWLSSIGVRVDSGAKTVANKCLTLNQYKAPKTSPLKIITGHRNQSYKI